MFRLTLCKNSCCPRVDLVNGRFVIKDDFGGQVALTPGQLKILVDKYPEIEEAINQCK